METVKKQICSAFCNGLSVREIANGLAISTIYDNGNGEPLGFYALGPDERGQFRLMDDGNTIPYLEAAGASLDSDTRFAAFSEIINQYGVTYHDIDRQIYLDDVTPDALPAQSLQFVALLMRIQDLLLMTRDRVENAFRDDVLEKLRDRFDGRASIKENQPISKSLGDVTPDMVIQAPSRQPVAVFIGTTSQKVTDAVLLHTLAMYRWKVPVRVVAVLESGNSLPRKFMQRAANYLDASPSFSGEETAALDRVEREVFGRDVIMRQVH